MGERFGDDPGARPRMLTLEMEYAALRFWAAIADGDIDRLRRDRQLGRS